MIFQGSPYAWSKGLAQFLVWAWYCGAADYRLLSIWEFEFYKVFHLAARWICTSGQPAVIPSVFSFPS